MGARLCLSHPELPIVLLEQFAYAKLIKSLLQRGRLSRFLCHYLIAYAKHAGRSKCVGLQASPSMWNSGHFIHFLIVPNSRVVWGWFIYAHCCLSVHFPFSSIVHSTETHETETRCRTHREELGRIPPSMEVETPCGRATCEQTITIRSCFSRLSNECVKKGQMWVHLRFVDKQPTMFREICGCHLSINKDSREFLII